MNGIYVSRNSLERERVVNELVLAAACVVDFRRGDEGMAEAILHCAIAMVKMAGLDEHHKAKDIAIEAVERRRR